MPSLGSDMTAGTVVEWRVRPGDRVARGDIVALVETEKGLIDVEIFDAGVIDALLVPPGTKVPVGTVLATLHADGEPAAAAMTAAVPPVATPTAPPVAPAAAPTPPAAAPVAPPPAACVPEPPAEPRREPAARIMVSPAARRLAEELGVDLGTVAGTGPRGAILKEDVVAAAAARRGAAAAAPVAPTAAEPPHVGPPVSSSPEPAIPDRFAAMRRAVATAMARSKREIPHYYLGTQIDMSRAMAWLAAENARRPVPDRLLPAALLLRAVALAAREVPEMNGFWRDGAFRPADAVHVGVAVALRGGGLVAPAIHDVDRKPVGQVMRELFDVVQRARGGRLRSSEVSDATITVTNLGDQGVESVFGVIHPPQVALVGFGRIAERPWAADGMLGVRPVVVASVSGDHRASDGHRGGRFLAAIARRLAAPEAP